MRSTAVARRESLPEHAGHLVLLRVIPLVHDLVDPRPRHLLTRLKLFAHLAFLQKRVFPSPYKAHQNGKIGHGGLHLSAFRPKRLICYPASDMAGSYMMCVAFLASQSYRLLRGSSERRAS